ncbi:unnamed protein product [Porites evermanni]|uniref:Protein DD3-3 n=1 Tax=Porites evermanni TaxID=104178 RepID=A0ABN8T1G7_9CNID|nr:unnamed protein product [Porites evermanni]
MLKLGFLVFAFSHFCLAAIYLHFIPGSNNRLNGNQANVRNANRLYDSQNNGKAGYNVGDSGSNNPGENIQEKRQRPLEFYMSGCDKNAPTEVEIMWTNQHGTGPKTDDRVETQVILQYMCQAYLPGKMEVKDINKDFQLHTIRNGGNRNTQTFRKDLREDQQIRKDRGLHEPKEYYNAYVRRERNKGLFTADQKLKGTTAQYTRQNANGNRRGLEVPEERDYYPYWGPTPWNDIAIMVSNKETQKLMKEYVNSRDFYEKWLCIMKNGLQKQSSCPRIPPRNRNSEYCVASYISRESCVNGGGKWTKVLTNYKERLSDNADLCASVKRINGVPYEAHKITQGSDNQEQVLVRADETQVVYAPSTVVNHNGLNMEGKFSSYKWKVPHFPSQTIQRCVLRIRYNITTDDAPRSFTTADNDKVKNDPTTLAVDGTTKLQLALNTAQLARTFQDRTHVFYLKPRPASIKNARVVYIGGMGKRGNIVQTYPAMEYRFVPERLTVSTRDVLCFAWSGSNNNPNNDGEGQARSDRTNVCWVKEGCSSLKPKACSSLPLEVVDNVNEFNAGKLNLHLNTGCYTGDAKNLQAQLNNAPASCNPPCFRIKKPGEYCYMSTRNNNFSNRRHMGQITVR